MTLSAGSRIGPYEIVSPLGAGGMGEVYKAWDTRLQRTVAIKVLAPHLSASPESRQRFEREARTISQLSHPHICALHDVGREGETEYLVMEYLEGETLSDRLLKGSLPLEQTLRYGVEIAGALDKAHRQGIVHRDLKPGNVMITKSGVKLLDFGLAKVVPPAVQQSSLTALPTQHALTQEGTILGTFQYMAPEQLEGKEADSRTDIFAFGCVLYEMTTGRKAFSGATQASLMSSILRDESPSISQVQPMAPTALDRVVRKCLAKDPEDRWQNAGDLASEIKWIGEGSSQAGLTVPVATRRGRRERVAWTVAGILALGLAASLLSPLSKSTPQTAIRFSVAPPEKATFVTFPEAGTLAFSPDGKSLALIGLTDGKRSLWVRRLDAIAATELKGTTGAISPFWSPDSRFIGYFAGGNLQKIAASGGPPQVLCESAAGSTGTWGRNGTILFSEFGAGREGIYRVSSEGGGPEQVTSPDRARGETSQAWPAFLPDGEHFLFLSGAFGPAKEKRTISVGSLGSRQTRAIVSGESRAAYCPPGYLLFAREGSLLAQPFDVRALRATGDPIPISDEIWMFRATGNAAFAVSEKGDVAYQSGRRSSPLTWHDRTGREIGIAAAPSTFGRPRLSPDGSRIAVQVADSRRGNRDIWIYEAERGLAQRLTEDPLDAVSPVWSPEGDRIAFGSGREGPIDIYVKPTEAAGIEELLLHEKGVQLPQDWAPDGSAIVYEDYSPGRSPQRQLWLLPQGGKRDRAPLLRTSFTTSQGRYSPDSRWLAFVSEETGRQEVYVVAATGQGAVRRVSASGGSLPRWRRDGTELFYLADNGDLVSVTTPPSDDLRLGSTSVLFTADPPPRDFDVSPDGRRFLFLSEGQGDTPRNVELTVIANWTSDLPKN